MSRSRSPRLCATLRSSSKCTSAECSVAASATAAIARSMSARSAGLARPAMSRAAFRSVSRGEKLTITLGVIIFARYYPRREAIHRQGCRTHLSRESCALLAGRYPSPGPHAAPASYRGARSVGPSVTTVSSPGSSPRRPGGPAQHPHQPPVAGLLSLDRARRGRNRDHGLSLRQRR